MGETRRRWTSVEDALLWELFQLQEKAPTGKCRKINWNEIARQIPGRSNKDCRKRFYNRFTGGLRKGSWTPDEDARLTALVQRYQYRWATIAQKMETRNADQCSKRWHHCLNPELERSPWTDAENELLLSAIETHGSSWKDIQKSHFPTRSANNIKNQHTVLNRRCIDQAPRQPCCNPRSFPHTRTNPPSSTSNITSNPEKQSLIPDEYPSNTDLTSLSSTPQPSSNEYLAMTPETPLAHHPEFDTTTFLHSDHLSNDPGQYLSDYWLTTWMDAPWTASNIDPVICQPPEMSSFGAEIQHQYPDPTGSTNTPHLSSRRFFAGTDGLIDQHAQFRRYAGFDPTVGFIGGQALMRDEEL